jgi:hypothetical protein
LYLILPVRMVWNKKNVELLRLLRTNRDGYIGNYAPTSVEPRA